MSGTDEKSPFTRTTSATLRAISEPLALGDREPRGLERRDVVHAVADHRDVAALGAQPLDERRFALGRDPADHERVERQTSRRSLRRPRAVADLDARVARRSRATVAGASPEMTRSSTPSARRNSTVSRASAAAPPTGRRARAAAVPAGGPSSALSAPVAVPNATTRRPSACSRVATRPAGRAETAPARRARTRCRRAAARSSAGPTRTARTRPGSSGARADRGRDRLERPVARRRAGGEPSELAPHLVRDRAPFAGLDRDDAQAGLR